MPPPAKVCIDGYAYAFDGKRNWRRASDERWDTEMVSKECGKIVGTRTIDGHRVHVIKGSDGRFYAVLPQYTR